MRRRHWRAATVALVCLAAMLATGPISLARAEDGGASWQFAPAEAPPPPEGAAPAPYGVQIGAVGQISFWAPNRGLMITAGNKLVSAGLYAYDGVSWHQLSKVCGGHDGRIAWAGPDEFWTISDQRPGQALPSGGEGALWDVSLCHFKEGQVVGSYAMPLEQPSSYKPMDAAACDSPNDCWFGGELDSEGAFHLHWNGSEVTVVNAPQDHAIVAMTLYDDEIYESVQLARGDSYTEEERAHPVLLHRIEPDDLSEPFHDVEPQADCAHLCTPLPEYGETEGMRVAPITLAGFQLSSDWELSGGGPASPELWAVAGPDGLEAPDPSEEGQGNAHPIALRYANGEWTQVVPNLVSFSAEEDPIGVAVEPPASGASGSEGSAWVMMHSGDQEAHLSRVVVEGDSEETASAKIAESDVLGAAQGVGPSGEARAIACPAAHECWLVTSEGWLFHLTNGTQQPKDTDPFFDGEDGVIEYRPPDDGVPQAISFAPPVEESLASLEPPTVKVLGEGTKSTVVKHSKAKPLLADEKTKLLHRDILELSFKLTAKAHVQLIAKRHGKSVAHTARRTLSKGRHDLKLRLNPKRWPTKLDLHATPAGKSAKSKSSGPSGEYTGGAETVTT